MELANVSDENVANVAFRNMECNAQVDDINPKVDDLFAKVDKLEQRVNEIEQFYLNVKIKEPNTSRSASLPRDKEKEKHVPSMKKVHQDASRREAAAAKRMQELMRHFGTIFRQAVYLFMFSFNEFTITQHKWAWPFMQPVDVEGLGLDDYYQIIDRPMDFTTIKNQMEAKDGTGYKHIREICSDVRLVFKNAMKYNDEKSDVHVMAKVLLEKFEEKWLQILPKVIEEEEKREAEETEAQTNIHLAQEANYARLARDINNELYEVDMHIEELRENVIKKCRRISTMEKRKLGLAIAQLCPENLSKALEIVALNNPNFQAKAEEVELDINAQSESTLWRLKYFLKDVLKVKSKDQNNDNTFREAANNQENNIVSKRKREICDALAKTAKKRKKQHSS
ncbi:DNA-binding bromodomain-containing family protein [Dorcoceras hygrometricum]|uniref:DNA-binding bromodomain-containing family protein n=2 Tax=Dorcoceras hygrometricum TaxID=472368 RepID=A0A2Z7BBC3_9LAMI|nr:DNA-binding bromodomain-containing family protein [Dorcoceras hygrometricum]